MLESRVLAIPARLILRPAFTVAAGTRRFDSTAFDAVSPSDGSNLRLPISMESRMQRIILRCSNPVGLILMGVVLFAALVACATGQPDASGHGDGYTLYPTLPHVTGHIDLVEPQLENPRYFSMLLITDADRQQWHFVSTGWVGVSVGHLKDHQIQGTPVTVWYEQRPDGSLLAHFVGD